MAGSDPSNRSVLLISDNGQGLGHVTRLMAIARRLPSDVRPFLLTFSEAHRTVRNEGFAVEYFPSHRRLRTSKTAWSALLLRRLQDAVDRFRPGVIIVDHVAPSPAFLSLRRSHPDVTLVWSRRGMWRPGTNATAQVARTYFHEILEPGDVARAFDRGFTAGDRAGVREVAPVTLLDRDELVPPAEARSALGLPVDRPSILVSLSADDPDDLEALIRQVRQVADTVRPDAHLFAPRHPLHGDRLADVHDVTMRRIYPLARYLRAFDVAVVAAGYNTCHEVVRAGVPAVFVAKETDSVDDQVARARGAAARGAGWMAPSLHSPEFGRALTEALQGGWQPPSLPDVVPNGAREAADWIASLARSEATPLAPPAAIDPEEPDEADLAEAQQRFVSGRGRPPSTRALDAVDLSQPDLASITKRLAAEVADGGPKTVLLVSARRDTGPLKRRSLVYETLLTPDQLRSVAPELDHGEYRRRRAALLAEVWGAPDSIVLRSAAELEDVIAGRSSPTVGRRLRRRLTAWRSAR